MNPEINSIVEEMKNFTPKNPIATSDIHTFLSIKSAQLSMLLTDESEKSTKKIVCLTWALFGLTVALLAVGVVQIVMFK